MWTKIINKINAEGLCVGPYRTGEGINFVFFKRHSR